MNLDNPKGLLGPQEPKPPALADGDREIETLSQAQFLRMALALVPEKLEWLIEQADELVTEFGRMDEMWSTMHQNSKTTLLAVKYALALTEPPASAPEVLPTHNEQEGPPA